MSLGFGFDAAALITGHFGSNASSKSDPFELRAGPFLGHELRVLSLSGRERVNDLYTYDVTFATEVPPEALPAAVFGEPARLTIKAPGFEPRIIEGIVSCFEALGGVPGEHGTKRRRYRLEIVPRLWLLKRRRRNRIFQNKSAPEIIDTLLLGIDVADDAVRWRIHKSDYPKRPFVYQRGETDFDFFCRVLADAGIFFYFEHASGLLDSLLPGAGQAAGLVTEAAGMLGGVAARAVGRVAKVTKSVTVLNFGDQAGHTPAVAAGLVSDLATEAIGAGLGAAAGAIGGAIGGAAGATFASSLVDEDPSDTLLFDDGTGQDSDAERVYAFALKKRLRTKELRMLDHDPQPPANWAGATRTDPVELSLNVSVAARAGLVGAVSGALSGGLSIGTGGISGGFGGSRVGAVAAAAGARVDFDVDAPNIKADEMREELYQVDRSVWQDKDVDKRMDMELERRRERYVEAVGRSDSRRLGAGYRFTLAGHPIGLLNGEYTITSIAAEGVHTDFATDGKPIFRNKFRCVPSKIAPWPKRPKRRPKPGMEIATVVNYIGGEALPGLQANGCGYVRVRFRWDVVNDQGTPRGGLELNDEDGYSVWVPVLQPWAGAGFGAQFIPREGMQVLVGFLEDQTERPVILGCLYSESNLPPWPESIDNQKIGIRSQTRPADGGYSEISIDDRYGGELLKLRAQRDLAIDVVHDARTIVGQSASYRVAKTLNVDVGGDLRFAVSGSEEAQIAGSLTAIVQGSSTMTVGAAHTLNVTGGASCDVGGSQRTSVGGEARCQVQGTRVSTVGADDVVTIGRSQRVVVGADGKDGVESDIYVSGTYRLAAKEGVTIESPKSLALRVGATELLLTPESLTLLAKAIAATASEKVQLTGAGPSIHIADGLQVTSKQIQLVSSGATLAMSDSAALTSSRVKLGSHSSSNNDSASDADPTKKPFQLTFLAPDHTPLKNCTYHLEVAGETTQGTLDSSGGLSGKVPDGIMSARCTVWTGEYHEGSRITYQIEFGDLQDASTVAGAQQRLRNLGYYAGATQGAMSFALNDAILAFQYNHGLDRTAVLDDATVAKLSEVHP